MRTNIYKEQIITLLQKKHFLTIGELHEALPQADYSTVFRNVEQLLKEKRVRKILIDNKSVAYESVQDLHDHFICTGCGKVESIHVALPQLRGHTVEEVTVRGVCTQCLT